MREITDPDASHTANSAPAAMVNQIGHQTNQIPIHVQFPSSSQSSTSTFMPSLTAVDPCTHDSTLATPIGDEIASTSHVRRFLADRGLLPGPGVCFLKLLGGTKSEFGAGAGGGEARAGEEGGEQMRMGGTRRIERSVACGKLSIDSVGMMAPSSRWVSTDSVWAS